MALLEARHLHKRFGDRVVLEDITLAIDEHVLTGIMGPNGAGKTTCFNVITGRYKPDRGDILLDGQSIAGLAPHEIARRGVSRSFQAISVFDEYTALENVLLAVPDTRARGSWLLHDPSRDEVIHDKAAAVLGRVGLSGREGTAASALSYGERRALEIGIALAAEPRVLFLDEPTAGLAGDAIGQLTTLIQRLREFTTIVLIEHNMHFLFSLADQVSVIHWGQVVARGTPAELQQDKWVRASNLGRFA
jgi:branched-chain amino acid transport system ATP-binding protein